MALTLNGTSNTISGLAVGGLPDGSVDADTLASNSVTTVKIADSTGTSDGVTTAKIANNAVTGAKTADEMTTSSTSLNIGGMRVVTGSFTTSSSATYADASAYGTSVQYYISTTKSNEYSGFAATPTVIASIDSDVHEANANVHSASTTGFSAIVTASRNSAIQTKTVFWIAIGVAS